MLSAHQATADLLDAKLGAGTPQELPRDFTGIFDDDAWVALNWNPK